jgi:hypothetical protein
MLNLLSRRKKIVISILLIAYAFSYFMVRLEKLLIHRVSYVTEPDQSKRYFHKISQGDFGVPTLTGRSIWIVADICNWVYFPLRIGESILWYSVPRKYEFRT